METNLLGYRKVNFTNNEGQTILGTSLWLAWALHGDEAKGYEAEKFFIADGGAVKLPVLEVDAEYIANFNSKGKLVSLIAKTN